MNLKKLKFFITNKSTDSNRERELKRGELKDVKKMTPEERRAWIEEQKKLANGYYSTNI